MKIGRKNSENGLKIGKKTMKIFQKNGKLEKQMENGFMAFLLDS